MGEVLYYRIRSIIIEQISYIEILSYLSKPPLRTKISFKFSGYYLHIYRCEKTSQLYYKEEKSKVEYLILAEQGLNPWILPYLVILPHNRVEKCN